MKHHIRIIFTSIILFSEGILMAQQLPEPMVPSRLVNDFTGLLSQDQQQALENKLVTFSRETTTQIAIVTWDDLQGYDINDFTQRLGQQWGIGQAGNDNGLLILVSPAMREVSIQTGYGLEGAVPDAIAKRLIGNVILPAFRQQDYYGGLDSATNVIISLTRDEYTADEYLEESGDGDGAAAIVILMIIFMIFMSGIFNRNRRFYSPTHKIPWWLLMSGLGSSKGSGWGDFKSGSGGFKGFGGGGGFGGFGGGSFGGGGASGRW